MNQLPIKNQKGFTLAEIVVVFSIFLMVISITFVSLKPLIRHIQVNNFLEQLQLDAAYSQMYALSNYKDVQIIFFPESHRYEITTGFNKLILVKRSYSSKIGIQLITLPATVTYLANGTIKKAGKMYVRYYDDVYTFVFLFGKGQTYVEKM